MTMFSYTTTELPLSALIDLTQIVGIKPNAAGDRLVVQLENARGLLLPFDIGARDALIAAWSETCAVFAYKFADADRDDAVITLAWMRVDKVKAVVQHHLDPLYLQVRTTSPRALILRFNASAVRELRATVCAV